MTTQIPQKLTFQEFQNNFFNKQFLRFFVLIFIGFLFACGQKKVESKVVDKQGDTIKTLTEKNINLITYNRDSLFQSLQNEVDIPDTAFIDYGIGSIMKFDVDGTKLAFIHFDNDCYGAGNMKKDLYILSFQNDKWRIIDSTKLDYEIHWIDTIYKIDINFDTKDEIVVKYSSLSGSRDIYPYEFFEYDKNTKQVKHFLSLSSSLDEIVNIKNKTIILGSDGGYYSQGKQVYSWQADTLQLLRSITARENGKGYRNVMEEKKFKNGIRIKFKKTTFTNSDKAWDYFENWQ